eukprot:gb/GEZN01008893.1/.p1 GENE.gb/GEZN01008893.1/~~gb/GEZN01008893.1/.p1  ORF type:complete len:391 (-),score=45.63 gb/GEZN01008893.1/:207-1232(-)
MSAPFCGKQVKIQETSREDLNGQIAWAIGFDAAKGRYTLRLSNGSVLSLKPSNLELISNGGDDDEPGAPPAGGFGGFGGAMPSFSGGLGGLLRHPQVAEALRRAKALAAQLQQDLPPGLTLQTAGLAVGALLFGGSYIFGFLRSVLLCVSVVALVVTAGPAYKAAGGRMAGLKAAATTVGQLLTEKMTELTGRPVNVPPLAMFGVVVVLFLGVFFMMGSGRKGVMPSLPGGGSSTSPQAAFDYASQDAYSAGWEDAKQNREYGTSLHTSRAAPVLPSASAGRSSFGIGSIVSLCVLGKTAFDLGGSPWSPQVALANFQNLETYRKVILAMVAARLFGFSPI